LARPAGGKSLLQRAEDVFLQHLQARNRLLYLAGVLGGGVATAIFGAVLMLVPDLTGPLPPARVPSVLLFAFMGAATSVLLRLSLIDLSRQTSAPLIILAGATRPTTAVFFAIVLNVLVSARLIEVHVGLPSDAALDPLSLVVSFLCGFSERFAGDILSRFGGGLGPAEKP
jgi:hypothetical protein